MHLKQISPNTSQESTQADQIRLNVGNNDTVVGQILATGSQGDPYAASVNHSHAPSVNLSGPFREQNLDILILVFWQLLRASTGIPVKNLSNSNAGIDAAVPVAPQDAHDFRKDFEFDTFHREAKRQPDTQEEGVLDTLHAVVMESWALATSIVEWSEDFKNRLIDGYEADPRWKRNLDIFA